MGSLILGCLMGTVSVGCPKGSPSWGARWDLCPWVP